MMSATGGVPELTPTIQGVRPQGTPPLGAALISDPDRTSRVRVDPWTGEVQVTVIGTPLAATDGAATVHPIPTIGPERRTLGVAATALLATTAAALGATAGSMLTLFILG